MSQKSKFPELADMPDVVHGLDQETKSVWTVAEKR